MKSNKAKKILQPQYSSPVFGLAKLTVILGLQSLPHY